MLKFPKGTEKKFSMFREYTTPSKIQDFIDTIPINFEIKGDTCRSPLYVLRNKEAHCIEGAMLAASILWFHGKKPLLLDLKTKDNDESHVVALFKENGLWGAISKTNHAVLRYRDPVFKNIHELVLSYFNEYFLDSGEKTLRSYTAPFNLLRYGSKWLTSDENLWYVVDDIDGAKHKIIAPKGAMSKLRLADPIEIKIGKVVEWNKKKNTP